ncbi:hypothetical protein ACHAWF_009062 [Thalassiosira exigua]
MATTSQSADDRASSPGCYPNTVAASQGTRPPFPYEPNQLQDHDRSGHDNRSRRSISELYRQRSSFGGLEKRHTVFDNVKPLLDSPTASATTGSDSYGSRPSPVTPFTPASGTACASHSGPTSRISKTSCGEVSPNFSVSSSGSISIGEHQIDHTALLLGFHDEFLEDSSDDEREWNACFASKESLDELEKRKAEVAPEGDGDECACSQTTESGNDEDQIDDLLQETASVESGSDHGLQLDFASATLDDIPVTSHCEIPPDANRCVEPLVNGDVSDPTHPQRQANIGSCDDDLRKPDLSTGEGDDWDEIWENGDVKDYASSTGIKQSSARARAMAMKERASSAFSTNAQRVSQKAKQKMKEKSAMLQKMKGGDRANILQVPPQNQGKCQDQPNATPPNFDNAEVLPQEESFEVGKIFQANGAIHHVAASVTKFPLKLHPKVSAIGAKSKKAGKSSVTQVSSRLSANVSSMKEKASSALTHKAQRAKEKTMVAVLATSSPLLKHKKTLSKVQQDLLYLPATQTKIDAESLILVDGGVPSTHMMSKSGEASTSIDCDSAGSTSIFKDSSLQVIGGTSIDETLPRSNTTKAETLHTIIGSPASPPPISTCLSNVSSTHNNSAVSCIDENGFLVSPTTSMDAALSIAGSIGAGSELDEPFDPNSFLFLSPLSNADMDDPDHGLPDLLSRSNHQNLIAVDSSCGPEMTAKLFSRSNMMKHSNKLLPRLPPSPRLLSSSKKVMKDSKGPHKHHGETPRMNFAEPSKQAIGTDTRPPLARHRRSRTAMI